jgi:hypothetical protein
MGNSTKWLFSSNLGLGARGRVGSVTPNPNGHLPALFGGPFRVSIWSYIVARFGRCTTPSSGAKGGENLPNMVGKPMEQPVGTPRGRGEPTNWVLGAQGGEVGRRLTAFPRSEQLAPVGCADGSICSRLDTTGGVRFCPLDIDRAAGANLELAPRTI